VAGFELAASLFEGIGSVLRASYSTLSSSFSSYSIDCNPNVVCDI